MDKSGLLILIFTTSFWNLNLVLSNVSQMYNNFEVLLKKYNAKKDLFLKVVFWSTHAYNLIAYLESKQKINHFFKKMEHENVSR